MPDVKKQDWKPLRQVQGTLGTGTVKGYSLNDDC